MLIRNARLRDGTRCDVRIAAGRIAQLDAAVPLQPGEDVVEADGGLLIPGLHDHHLHLAALAAAQTSVACGPPQVLDEAGLVAALRTAAAEGQGWLRGIGYHDSVAGPLDRSRLDAWVPDRPLRIQHRSGQLWVLNSLALQLLAADATDSPCERVDGRLSGRLFRGDDWLRGKLAGRFPELGALSAQLAARGLTGLTDASPANDAAQAEAFVAAQQRGELRQSLWLLGSRELERWTPRKDCGVGAWKIHLNETVLPDFDRLVAGIAAAHAAGRCIAVHCTTRTELVYTLAALEAAGAKPGDRIEHASVTPPEAFEQIAAMGLCVVSQPHFIAERGERYRVEVASSDRPWLYRARSFIEHGMAYAAGSDAPYGRCDPWQAMQDAVTRRTANGSVLGASECLSPEQALDSWLGSAESPAQPRRVAVGEVADLCLLKQDWAGLRTQLHCAEPRLVLRAGRAIHRDPATAAGFS